MFAEGYAFERMIRAEVAGEAEHPNEVQEWMERVLVVRSESYRQTLQKGLEERLQRATDKLLALTPPQARGKHQIRDEAKLVQAVESMPKNTGVTRRSWGAAVQNPSAGLSTTRGCSTGIQ